MEIIGVGMLAWWEHHKVAPAAEKSYDSLGKSDHSTD